MLNGPILVRGDPRIDGKHAEGMGGKSSACVSDVSLANASAVLSLPVYLSRLLF